MKELLTLKHISKSFHNKEVLKNISFSIPKGSIFAFLGPNGSGKSTLLHIIMQILTPSQGIVTMNNQQVKKDKIGFVFQENTLDEELTVYENLYIRGRLYKIPKQKIKQKIKELSTYLGMKEFIDKKYKICSGGQKRISMIARALLMNPEIIIMDEPTTALDIETRKKVWSFLLKLNKEKAMAIFFSSHYIEEAEVATNLCIIKSGQIIFNGYYQELMKKYSKKKLQIDYKNKEEIKEISSMDKVLHYLEQLPWYNIETLSITNSSLEEIFLKLIHENVNC